jgi:hypothetical protein
MKMRGCNIKEKDLIGAICDYCFDFKVRWGSPENVSHCYTPLQWRLFKVKSNLFDAWEFNWLWIGVS